MRPGLFAAVRLEHLGFSEVAGSAGLREWEAPVGRLEAGIGYSLQRNLLLKLSLQHNSRDGGRVPVLSFGAAQLVFWFYDGSSHFGQRERSRPGDRPAGAIAGLVRSACWRWPWRRRPRHSARGAATPTRAGGVIRGRVDVHRPVVRGERRPAVAASRHRLNVSAPI